MFSNNITNNDEFQISNNATWNLAGYHIQDFNLKLSTWSNTVGYYKGLISNDKYLKNIEFVVAV